MKDFIIDTWSSGWIGRGILGIIVLLILMIPVTIYSSIKDYEQWEIFKVEHNCKIVGRERGNISTGVSPIIGSNGGVGVIVVSSPDKTGWKCDDGITYWR